jgi:hypothetical protein
MARRSAQKRISRATTYRLRSWSLIPQCTPAMALGVTDHSVIDWRADRCGACCCAAPTETAPDPNEFGARQFGRRLCLVTKAFLREPGGRKPTLLSRSGHGTRRLQLTAGSLYPDVCLEAARRVGLDSRDQAQRLPLQAAGPARRGQPGDDPGAGRRLVMTYRLKEARFRALSRGGVKGTCDQGLGSSWF